MREQTLKRVVSLLIIGGIAFVFAIQWGPGSKGCESPLVPPPPNAVATVNGKEVPIQEFRMAYANQLRAYSDQLRQFGGSGMDVQALARQMGLPNQLLEQMITFELLAQAAEARGIEPSNEELAEYIRGRPEFQAEGRFSRERYQQMVSGAYRQTIPQFEAVLRREMAAQKLMAQVENAVAVSDEEVRTRFLAQEDRAKVTLVRFLPSMYAEAGKLSPQQAQAYLEAHRDEVEAHYEANRLAYQQPEQVRARHILLQAGQGTSVEERRRARERLEALREEIAGGRDFAEVAREHSEDTATREQGGDLGFNPRQAWVPAFADAAFGLEPGELSEVVETPFGFHLIRVEERRPAVERSLEDVQLEIATQLAQRARAEERARADAEKALSALVAGEPLAAQYPPAAEDDEGGLAFEEEARPAAFQTDELTLATDTLPRLGRAPELRRAIFATTGPGPLRQVFEVGEGFVVASVDERRLPDESALQTRQEELRQQALRAKQLEQRRTFPAALRQRAEVVTYPELLEEVIGSG